MDDSSDCKQTLISDYFLTHSEIRLVYFRVRVISMSHHLFFLYISFSSDQIKLINLSSFSLHLFLQTSIGKHYGQHFLSVFKSLPKLTGIQVYYTGILTDYSKHCSGE